MKFTIDEFRRILDAVNHEAHRAAKESVSCAEEGRGLAANYYGGLEQDYKELFDKLVEMMDDITE